MLQRGSSNPEGSLVVFTDTKMNADVACCSVRIRLRSRIDRRRLAQANYALNASLTPNSLPTVVR